MRIPNAVFEAVTTLAVAIGSIASVSAFDLTPTYAWLMGWSSNLLLAFFMDYQRNRREAEIFRQANAALEKVLADLRNVGNDKENHDGDHR